MRRNHIPSKTSVMAKDLLRDLSFAFVGLVVTALASALWGHLSSRMALYDVATMIVAAAVFVALFTFDRFSTSGRGQQWTVFALYALFLVVFLVLTSLMPEAWIRAHLPVLASFAVLGLGKLSLIGAATESYFATQSFERGTGHATTGIVIVEGQEPSFILVFNKNLRGGRGLWVPPGGHFRPARDNPDQRLIQKLETEIGMRCEIIPTHHHCLPEHSGDRRTESADWIEPPAFVLRENMFGRCSEGHDAHFDMVYLCRTDGTSSGFPAKYDLSQQIRIPIGDCSTSVDVAEEHIRKAIDQWERESSGVVSGIRNDLTRDVIWRLHLGARLYSTRDLGERSRSDSAD